MKIKDVKAKINLALESVKSLDEPYKLETYKIIFSKDLNSGIQEESNDVKKNVNNSKKELKNKENLDENFRKLSSRCKISPRELSDILKIENGKIIFKKTFTGTEKEQQISATQLILLAYEVIYKIYEIDSATLKAELKKFKILDKNSNMARILKERKDLFSTASPNSRKNTYSLTAKIGTKSALALLTKLANGEEIESRKFFLKQNLSKKATREKING